MDTYCITEPKLVAKITHTDMTLPHKLKCKKCGRWIVVKKVYNEVGADIYIPKHKNFSIKRPRENQDGKQKDGLQDSNTSN